MTKPSRTLAGAALSLVLSSLGALGAGSCGSGGGGDEATGSSQSALCGAAVDRLQECGVVTRGYFECREPYTPEADCLLACLRDAECDAVRAVACDAAITSLNPVALLLDENGNTNPPPQLSECYLACAPGPRMCSVGEGGVIPVNVLIECDGVDQCADGGDEADCARHAPFACPVAADQPPHVISADRLCDGQQDCPEGGDEADCPRFLCEDGGMILEGNRCNGSPDCADDSDETDCGVLVCD